MVCMCAIYAAGKSKMLKIRLEQNNATLPKGIHLNHCTSDSVCQYQIDISTTSKHNLFKRSVLKKYHNIKTNKLKIGVLWKVRRLGSKMGKGCFHFSVIKTYLANFGLWFASLML